MRSSRSKRKLSARSLIELAATASASARSAVACCGKTVLRAAAKEYGIGARSGPFCGTQHIGATPASVKPAPSHERPGHAQFAAAASSRGVLTGRSMHLPRSGSLYRCRPW